MHVLEFRATGDGMFVERHFPVVNPTDVDYAFKWICRDQIVDQSKKPPFRCCVPSGSIISGQQCTVGWQRPASSWFKKVGRPGNCNFSTDIAYFHNKQL